MNNKNLSEKIKAEEEKLETLKNKREEIDKKIESIENSLEKYRLMANNSKYIELQNAAKETGISVEDILEALQSGSLDELQSLITIQKQTEASE